MALRILGLQPSGLIEGWGTETGTLSIAEDSATNLVAPYETYLEATSDFAGADPDHDIEYVWDLGPDAPSFSSPVNYLNNSSRYMMGRRTTIVLPTADRWTIRCTAIDKRAGATNGNWQTTSITREVATKAAFYGSANSIVVAADSDYTGAPDHDTVNNRDTSISDAMTRANAIGGDVIIYLKRGESYDERIIPGSGLTSIHIAPWGTGDNPTIAYTGSSDTVVFSTGFGFGNGTTPIPMILEDLDFEKTRSPQDPETTTYTWMANNQEYGRLLVKGGSLTGYTIGFNGGAANTGRHTFYDFYANNLYSSVYTDGNGDGVAFIGCRIQCDPNDYALWSGFSAGWLCRSKGKGFATVYAWNDLFSFKGQDNGSGIAAQQACVRLSGDPDAGHVICVFGNVTEGGFFNLATDDVATIASKKLSAFVRYNFHMAASKKEPVLESFNSGVSVENNVIVYPASDDAASPSYQFDAVFRIRKSDEPNMTAAAKAGLFRFNNNTVLVRDSNGTLAISSLVQNDDPTVFTNVVDYDTLLQAPYQSTPVTTYAPIDTTKRANIAHRYIGYQDDDTALVAGSRTPSNVIVVDSISGGSFAEEANISDGTNSAEVYRVEDAGGTAKRLWTGPISPGSQLAAGTITQGAVSGTAANPSEYGGPAVVAAPISGSTAIDAGSIPSGEGQPALTLGTPSARGATYSIGALED